jgi:NitT/TauT family transport system substrate-binding protein
MNKITLAIVGVLALAVISFLVYQQTPKQPRNLEKITIAQAFEVFLYAPLYVAQEKGFFKDEGLDVNVTTAGGDEKAFAALLSGDAQFSVGDPTFVAVSGEKGQPGKVVAAVLRGVPFWGVAKKSNIGVITTPSGLNGYSVATFPSPSTAYVLQKKMFQTANIASNIKETAFGSLLVALDTGGVDIALELEPNVSTAVKNGDHIVYSLNDYYPEFAITGMTALPSYVEKNPETTQKVVNALQMSMKYIREHPNEVADFLTTKFPDVPKNIAESAVQNMIKAGVFPSDTVVTKAGWDAAIQARVDVGDLKSLAPYENYVNTNFSERAK